MGLFDPLWMTDNDGKEAKAAASVGRISDAAELIRIASEAPLSGVKAAARARLANCMLQADWPAVGELLCKTKVQRTDGGDPEPGEEEVCKRLIERIRDEALRDQRGCRREHHRPGGRFARGLLRAACRRGVSDPYAGQTARPRGA